MGTDDEGQPADVTPDDGEAGEQDHEEGASEGFDRWRKDSAFGGIGTGIARGLQASSPRNPTRWSSWPRSPAIRPMPIRECG